MSDLLERIAEEFRLHDADRVVNSQDPKRRARRILRMVADEMDRLAHIEHGTTAKPITWSSRKLRAIAGGEASVRTYCNECHTEIPTDSFCCPRCGAGGVPTDEGAPTRERRETGVMQEGDDWPGIFIRGDEALALAGQLRAVLARVVASEGVDDIFAMRAVHGLRELLLSCRVTPTTDDQPDPDAAYIAFIEQGNDPNDWYPR